jgi:molecular chaperone GrpE
MQDEFFENSKEDAVRPSPPTPLPKWERGVAPATVEQQTPAAGETDWQALAQRMQADMENFRKRQIRQANEAVVNERERLLRRILPIVDNLDRALSQDAQQETSLRQGIELTYRELMRILEGEGVTRLESVGQPFDPNWHEALASAPGQAAPNTVIKEVEAGYKLGDKLLRPARVIVAA